MITDLKIYIIIVLALWQGIAQWQLHSVKTDYQEYKDSINDQVQKAKNEKIRIESEQREKLDKAKLDYSDSSSKLAAALKRLRDAEIMPGNCSMPMAGNSASSVSRRPEDTTGIINTAEITARIGSFNEFYEMSMRDTLQCSKLIEFINVNNLGVKLP